MHALVGISLCYKQIKPKEKTKLNIKNPKSKSIIISISSSSSFKCFFDTIKTAFYLSPQIDLSPTKSFT